METKLCQFCWEEIADQALVCKNCKNWQVEEGEIIIICKKVAVVRAFSTLTSYLFIWIIALILSIQLLMKIDANQMLVDIWRIVVILSFAAIIIIPLRRYFLTRKMLLGLVDSPPHDLLLLRRQFQKEKENSRLFLGSLLLAIGVFSLSKYSEQFFKFQGADDFETIYFLVALLLAGGVYLTVSGIIRELKDK